MTAPEPTPFAPPALCSCGMVRAPLVGFRLCRTCDVVPDKEGLDPVRATWLDRIR